MRHLTLPAAALLVSTLAGCASGGASDGGERSGPPMRWTGSFQPQQQLSGAVTPTGTARMFGTVSITPVNNANRSRVSLMLNTPVSNTTLSWAVLPGRCGSPALPVLSFDQFPLLEIGSSGRAQLDIELAMTYPTSGTYHVAVYQRGGTDASDVITCANLRGG